MPHEPTEEIKTVGASGQISLGKEFAGRTVIVEHREPGVWHIRTAQVIPDNEMWIHTPEVKKALDEALAWSATHPRKETNLEELRRKISRMK
jgi:hypothetical protein